MRVVVVTAIIGDIDEPKGLPKQNFQGYDYFFYHENNLPYPLPNLDNRLKSKYIKTQMHRFLPGYDVYVWLDGSVKVTGTNFIEHYLTALEGKEEIAIYKHSERQNVYEELTYIEEQIKKGNQYLITRYGKQQLMKEALFYAKEGLPYSLPLFNCYTFAYKNTERTRNCFDEWWRRCVEFSNFDQAMFSYVTWKAGMNLTTLNIDPLRTHKLFIREPHTT